NEPIGYSTKSTRPIASTHARMMWFASIRERCGPRGMHREWVLGGAKPPLELQGRSKLADRLTHLFINKIRDFLGGFALFNSPSDTRFALFKNFQILGFQVAIFRDGTDVFSNALLLSSKALDIFTGFFQFPVRIDLLPACLGKLCKLFRHPLVAGGRRPAQ